jgi:hypothetical protein
MSSSAVTGTSAWAEVAIQPNNKNAVHVYVPMGDKDIASFQLKVVFNFAEYLRPHRLSIDLFRYVVR